MPNRTKKGDSLFKARSRCRRRPKARSRSQKKPITNGILIADGYSIDLDPPQRFLGLETWASDKALHLEFFRSLLAPSEENK